MGLRRPDGLPVDSGSAGAYPFGVRPHTPIMVEEPPEFFPRSDCYRPRKPLERPGIGLAIMRELIGRLRACEASALETGPARMAA